jgi:WD40 repeat protein
MRNIMSLIRASNREFSYNDAIGNYAVTKTFDPETRTFFGHGDAVKALDVSPFGRYVISGSCDSTVRLWDLRSRKCLWIFGGHDGGSGFSIHDVAVSSNGRRVLTLTNKFQVWRLSSKTIRRYLWGILREKPLFVIDDESLSGSCIVIAAGGSSIFITTDRERTVSLFQLRTRERRRVFDLENQVARSIAVAQGEAILAVGTDEGAIVLLKLH